MTTTISGMGSSLWVKRGAGLYGVPARRRFPINGLEFYAPLWHPELSGATFNSKDLNSILCTVTDAVWGSTGRTFDGSDKIQVANHAAIQACRETFSVMVRMKATNQPTGAEVVVCRMDYGADRRTWVIQGTNGVNTANVILYHNGLNIFKNFKSSVEPFDGSSHLFGFTYDKPTLLLYMGGTVDPSPTKAIDNDNSCYDNDIDMVLGSALSNGALANGFDGLEGEVWVYSRVLSAVECKNMDLTTKWRY